MDFLSQSSAWPRLFNFVREGNMAAKKIESEYLSLSEVAAVLGKPARTVRRWVLEEKLEAETLFGRYIVSREYFERWKKRNIVKKARD